MSGLRIHFVGGQRNCVLLVRHPGNAQGRKPKDYQIRLDNEGDAIVSDTVWMRLQQAAPHAFLLMNEVPNPPTQYINGGQTEETRMYKLLQNIAQEFAPNGVVPRITKKDKN